MDTLFGISRLKGMKEQQHRLQALPLHAVSKEPHDCSYSSSQRSRRSSSSFMCCRYTESQNNPMYAAIRLSKERTRQQRLQVLLLHAVSREPHVCSYSPSQKRAEAAAAASSGKNSRHLPYRGQLGQRQLHYPTEGSLDESITTPEGSKQAGRRAGRHAAAIWQAGRQAAKPHERYSVRAARSLPSTRPTGTNVTLDTPLEIWRRQRRRRQQQQREQAKLKATKWQSRSRSSSTPILGSDSITKQKQQQEQAGGTKH